LSEGRWSDKSLECEDLPSEGVGAPIVSRVSDRDGVGQREVRYKGRQKRCCCWNAGKERENVPEVKMPGAGRHGRARFGRSLSHSGCLVNAGRSPAGCYTITGALGALCGEHSSDGVNQGTRADFLRSCAATKEAGAACAGDRETVWYA
jgi:hypothetical protein